MVKLKGKIIKINLDYLTHKPQLEIQLNNQECLFNEEFEKIKDKELDIELKIYREKRSLNANAYLWVLCDKIAKEINQTKEFVYKKAISEIGQFEVIPIKDEAVEKFIIAWESRGVGWLCEKLGESKFKGFVNLIAYYGSSSYDTKAMSILLNYVVDEAKELGLQIISEEELQSLIKEYGG